MYKYPTDIYHDEVRLIYLMHSKLKSIFDNYVYRYMQICANNWLTR
jgi:hypothetical protein